MPSSSTERLPMVLADTPLEKSIKAKPSKSLTPPGVQLKEETEADCRKRGADCVGGEVRMPSNVLRSFLWKPAHWQRWRKARCHGTAASEPSEPHTHIPQHQAVESFALPDNPEFLSTWGRSPSPRSMVQIQRDGGLEEAASKVP